MTKFTGPLFISDRGADELKTLRVNSTVTATGGRAPVELLARLPSEECGCPEELWRIDGIDLLFHFEHDGKSHAMIFAGDFEIEKEIEATTLNDLRAKAFQWFANAIEGSRP